MALTHENLELLTTLPSALFGPYVSAYLAHTTTLTYQGARSGIDAQVAILFGEHEAQQEEALTVIENLGSAVEVDMTELLNRSPEREKTLNEYVAALRALLTMGQNQITALDARRDAISDDRRAKRKRTADIQHDLNQALRGKNYSIAGSKQEELTTAEKELAEVQAQEKHIQSLTDILKDLVDVGKERLIAVENNRGALIAGVSVVEVPGIEEIGVLKTTRRRSRSSSLDSIFDPGTFGE